MCTGVEIALVAGMALSAAGTASAMDAQAEAGQNALNRSFYNKEMSDYNAERIREQSKDEASKYISAGARLRQTQAVQQAASGIVIGEGSAQAILDSTTNLSQQDALVVMYNGIEGEVGQKEQGRLALQEGRTAASAAKKQQQATLLSGAGSMIGQYSTYKMMTTPRT